jgi:integrase/recombinase XerD
VSPIRSEYAVTYRSGRTQVKKLRLRRSWEHLHVRPSGCTVRPISKERVYLKAVTPKTKVWYETAWKAFNASQAAVADGERQETASISKARLQAFVVLLRDRGIRPRSVNTYLQALNAFAHWLPEEGHQATLIRVPLLRTEERIIATLSEPQLRNLLAFKPRTIAWHRLHTLASTILDTGIRIDEALKIRWSDVDFENLLLTVYGKGNKERRIPFSFELRKKLFRYQQILHKRELKFDLVFATRRGTHLTQRNSLGLSTCCRKSLGYRSSAGIGCDTRSRLSTCALVGMWCDSRKSSATRQ